MECIKVVLVSPIKIASLKKHKQTAGSWSVSKVARQTGSFGSSYQEGKQNLRNKRPNNREFLVLNTDCQLFTAGSRAMDIPEVLCKWITCHLWKGSDWIALYSLYFLKTLKNSPKQLHVNSISWSSITTALPTLPAKGLIPLSNYIKKSSGLWPCWEQTWPSHWLHCIHHGWRSKLCSCSSQLSGWEGWWDESGQQGCHLLASPTPGHLPKCLAVAELPVPELGIPFQETADEKGYCSFTDSQTGLVWKEP